MLRDLRLINFRSFQNFKVTFGNSAYLVGPNNAGKSTILSALRAADVLIRQAHRRKPTIAVEDNGKTLPAHPISLPEFPALLESVRHEFHTAEARLELTFKNHSRLVVVWPSTDHDDDVDEYFYLEKKDGFPVREIGVARATFPRLGVIPILAPVEHSELLLDDKYVERNVEGRLSSRHFRNQLRLLQHSERWTDFLQFAEPRLGGITLAEEIKQRFTDRGAALDVFYTEQGSRIPKELVWAGDGVQIWLQLLYHIFRAHDRESLILDEPEVYLHPDLQRRLVHILEETGAQIVMATHSSELVTEADSRNVVLIEKSRRQGRRVRDDSMLEILSSALGTAFNLRLARALTARAVLFVEGQDMTILRRFAKKLGLSSIANEDGIVVIPLLGYGNWTDVRPFGWLCRNLLPDAMKISVLLDRDYRSDATSMRVEEDLSNEGTRAHVWRRKELESYLLEPSVISRQTGGSVKDIERILDESTLSMESSVFSRMFSERRREEVSNARHEVTVMESFKEEFDRSWKDREFRIRRCPPKDILTSLNRQVQALGKKTVSLRSLASAFRSDEIDFEMAEQLRKIEHDAQKGAYR